MKNLRYIFPLLLLLACSQKQNKTQKTYFFEGNALGTTYHITAIADSANQRLSKQNIDSVIVSINASLSTYNKTSLISKLNRGEVLKVDSQFVDVYKAARQIYLETAGAYDPTIGILVNAWGFGPKEKIKNIENDASIVDSLKQFVGYDMLQIDTKGFLQKKYPQVYIDYNSIAKGYAIDRVGAMLAQHGFANYLVEIGGEVLAKGKKINKDRSWQVAIDNPNRKNDHKYISEVALQDKAMATSGNYRKYYIDKKTGRKYVHTLDPKTGYPIQSNLLSASVVAGNCTMADGYATAFMVLGLEKSKKFLQQHPELQAFLVYSDDKGNVQVFSSKSLNIIE